MIENTRITGIDDLPDNVLVQFYTDECEPCGKVSTYLRELDPNSFGWEFIRIDASVSKRLNFKFRISSVPTLILYNNKREVGRIKGYADMEQIKEFLSNT